MTMKNKVLISITAILVVALVGVTIWLGINADAIGGGIKGGGLYTAKDIQDAYDKGYGGAIGDTDYYEKLIETLYEELERQKLESDRVLRETVKHYEDLIANLEQQIADYKLESDRRYVEIVEYYENEITRLKEQHAEEIRALNEQLARQIEYTRLLEQYIFGIEHNPAMTSEELLALQLGIFEEIEARIGVEIIHWQGVLDALPAIGRLETATNDAYYTWRENLQKKEELERITLAMSVALEMMDTWTFFDVYKPLTRPMLGAPLTPIDGSLPTESTTLLDGTVLERADVDAYMASLGVTWINFDGVIYSCTPDVESASMSNFVQVIRQIYMCNESHEQYQLAFGAPEWTNKAREFRLFKEDLEMLQDELLDYSDARIATLQSEYETKKDQLDDALEQQYLANFMITQRGEDLATVQEKISQLKKMINEKGGN